MPGAFEEIKGLDPTQVVGESMCGRTIGRLSDSVTIMDGFLVSHRRRRLLPGPLQGGLCAELGHQPNATRSCVQRG